MRPKTAPQQTRKLPNQRRTCGRALRDVLHSGDIAIRKTYLHMFAGKVRVSDTGIRLSGPTAVLASSASADQLPDITMVPSSVPEWRTMCDKMGTGRA
jgi:hypothetical protein